MAFEFEIDAASRLVRIRMWGPVVLGDIFEVTRQITCDPSFQPGFSELIDLRELTSTATLTADNLRELASSPLDPVALRAFVTPHASTFGLVRMFETYREINRSPERIAVFKELAEAEAWLRREMREPPPG